MELWAKIGEDKIKFQGSFKSVMEQLLEKSQDKDATLLSFHTNQKERRRFKREYRAVGKNLVQLAQNYLAWSYLVEIRRLNRKIKELNKRKRVEPKRATFYENQIKEIRKQIEELENKLNNLC
ncbi:MAG: hypothetical protein GXO22_01080 [Aquificae bacterium]|nr:hypothetical protein [Aquificota bacterium]